MLTRILLVDDSAYFRRQLTMILEEQPDFRVVGRAGNGRDALNMVRRLRPDVVILDIEMPVMDGLDTLAHIMSVCPVPVVIFSTLAARGAETSLRALDLGAVDVVLKPRQDKEWPAKAREIVVRVRAAARANLATMRRRKGDLPRFRRSQFDVVVIGCSTGGPAVLSKILPALPAAFPLPVVVAQHMPAEFTIVMTERLARFCPVNIKVAEHGELLKPAVYMAPGGTQTVLERQARGVALTVGPQPDYRGLYKPSVDLLFASAARVFGQRVLALVLTGMGRDGSQGAAMLHQLGAVVYAQSKESCVIPGMPEAVLAGGWARGEMDPAEIAELLTNL